MRTLLTITLLLLGTSAWADDYVTQQQLQRIEQQLQQIQTDQFFENGRRMDAEWRAKNGY